MNNARKSQFPIDKHSFDLDEEGISILKCREHKTSITCICVSSNNKYIFSGSKDGAIVKWSLEKRSKEGSLPFAYKEDGKEIKGHSRGILSIAISSDNKYLAVGDETMYIQIWDPQKLKHIHTLKGHQSSVTAIKFKLRSNTLYSASKDKIVKVWDLDEMAYVESVFGHTDAITAIDVLSADRVITAGGRDNTLRIWKFCEETQLIYKGHNGSIDCVVIIDEGHFASGGDDGQICVWRIGRKRPVYAVKDAHGVNQTNGESFWITSLASFINSDLLASGSEDGYLRLWRLEKGFNNVTMLRKIQIVGVVNDLKFTNDGKCLLAGVGKEHRFGRWTVKKSAKNSVVLIPVLHNVL
ncbi:PREDICTED: U3 small nucleolar RNA-interacting protein 2-like [Nicrophorus vespilloides]|uniref:U3 small nucleolar RNA-interacting protein 2-like n=1 Tax=Nicrophorus vespilloides TaxID=110193 RepID=A0ABM1NEH2_NICVS|nr:PREDICTED: U3 small nucleolar RNA-interacting protein 2-like [Nicrophorus vespilloides]